jgi:Xaa-Pro aminopeptidase
VQKQERTATAQMARMHVPGPQSDISGMMLGMMLGMMSGGGMMLTSRLERLRHAFAATGAAGAAEAGPVQGLLVTRPENRFYLTGFTGSSGYVLVTQAHALLLTDFRYTEQAAAQAPGYQIVRHGSPWFGTFGEQVAALGLNHIGFESDHINVADHQALQAAVPGVRLTPLRGVVEGLRLIKEDAEIETIARAVAWFGRCIPQASGQRHPPARHPRV